jgi:TonB family protein
MRKVHGLTIVASIGVHAVLAGGLSRIALGTALRAEGAPGVVALEEPRTPRGSAASSLVELPLVGEVSLVDEKPVQTPGDPPRVTAGDEIAHLDTQRAGAGGDLRSQSAALNLADRDEALRLSPDLLSRLDRDQLQRLHAGSRRQSWEDRRATTHPAELTFVATGAGVVVERRMPATAEPSRGVLQSPSAATPGSAVGPGGLAENTDEGSRRGGLRAGSSSSAPGLGLREAQAGLDHRASAPIASARPDVTRAAVAVPALEAARPEDNVDSEQEVATTVRSLVHASSAGGLSGDGRGGSGAGGDPGEGGAGAGSRARPLGYGEGDVVDLWTSDPRFVSYFRGIRSKIDPLWADAFPRSALLEQKQGTVILEFVIQGDGRVAVAWPPARPSGIDEFDRKCADAIRRASPLPPIPRELGTSILRVRYRFEATYSIIQ